jgi:hypothetical protein
MRRTTIALALVLKGSLMLGKSRLAIAQPSSIVRDLVIAVADPAWQP